MSDAADRLLWRWIERQAPHEASEWLAARLAALAALPPDAAEFDRHLTLAFARVPRLFGRADLALTPADLAAAEGARPGWMPAGWSLDGAARVLLLHRAAVSQNGESFARQFQHLRQMADPAEQIALFRGLPLYPHSAALEAEAGEGLRSNMRPIFEAIAHRNPYPREIFDQHRWNHMVLKALFVGSALAPIQGLAERRNLELAVILRDYARERRAAGRPVPAELWPCVAPFAAPADALDDLTQAAMSDDPDERAAASSALKEWTT